MNTPDRTLDAPPRTALAKFTRRTLASARNSTIAALLLSLACLVIPACKQSKTTSAAKSLPKVVCTTGMIGDAARVIGGDTIDLFILMGEGVDPHLYKPSPGDMRRLSEADLVLYNGLHLEGRMVDVLEKLAEKKTVRAVSDAIDHASLRTPPEFEGQHDPHVWFDVSLWIHAVRRAAEAVSAIEPAHRADCETRAAAYITELENLHRWVGVEIAKIPESRRVLITAHDAFGYFGRAYGIEVRAIQGVSTDSEAGIKAINDLVDFIVARKIPAVFVESSVPRKTIEALVEGCKSRNHPIRIGGELYSDALGAANTPDGTYIGMVQHNVRTIVAALAPDAAPQTSEGKP